MSTLVPTDVSVFTTFSEVSSINSLASLENPLKTASNPKEAAPLIAAVTPIAVGSVILPSVAV